MFHVSTEHNAIHMVNWSMKDASHRFNSNSLMPVLLQTSSMFGTRVHYSRDLDKRMHIYQPRQLTIAHQALKKGVHTECQGASVVNTVGTRFDLLPGAPQPPSGAIAFGKTATNNVTAAINKVLQVSSHLSDSLSSQGTGGDSAVSPQSATTAESATLARSAAAAESAVTAQPASGLAFDEDVRTRLLVLWNAEREDMFFNPDRLTDAQWAICSKVNRALYLDVYYGCIATVFDIPMTHRGVEFVAHLLLCTRHSLSLSFEGMCVSMLSMGCMRTRSAEQLAFLTSHWKSPLCTNNQVLRCICQGSCAVHGRAVQ